MGKDQHIRSGTSSDSSSPQAKRRARTVSAGVTTSAGGSSPSRKKRVSRGPKDSRNDWQIPDEGSGRLRKLSLVAGGVVAVVACGMVWQSTMDPEPITAADHPAIASSGATGEVGTEPAAASPDAGSVSPSQSTSATNLQEIWKSRIAGLDSQRIKAFENKDASALTQVNVPDSPAQTHDAKLLATLESRQAKPVSLATKIQSATLISGNNESALVEVVDSRSEYVVTTESMSKTIKRFKAKQAKWRVSLRNSDGTWRFYSVVPAGA